MSVLGDARFRAPTIGVLVLCGLLALLAAADSAVADDRPNIVIIMADDLGYSDIGCYGGEIQTPVLNRLAEEGLRFTQFYNTSKCCPTRASLLTGLYAHQADIGSMMVDLGVDGYHGSLSRDSVTIAEVLGSAGYRTLMCGKWHVTPWNESQDNWPLQRGFDHFYGTILGAGSYFMPASLVRDNTPIENYPADYYYTDAISERAAEFVSTVPSEKRQPFFLYVAYSAPHWPLHALPEDIARYEGRYDSGWDALRRERYHRMLDMGIVEKKWALSPRDPGVSAWEGTQHKEWQASRMEVYAAQVDRMDQGIGKIVAALEETGELDNTLLMFLSDNGGCRTEYSSKRKGFHLPEKTRDGRPVRPGSLPAITPGPEDTFQSYGRGWANASNTPLRLYKSHEHEGGTASPLVVHWPRVIENGGQLTHQVGHVIDLMATCVDVAGATYPARYGDHVIKPLEGISLAPVFREGRRQGHRALFWEHGGARAVRSGDWKLVSTKAGPWELYDLAADRTETNDRAEQEPERVRQLKALYDGWAARAGVRAWPLEEPKEPR